MNMLKLTAMLVLPFFIFCSVPELALCAQVTDLKAPSTDQITGLIMQKADAQQVFDLIDKEPNSMKKAGDIANFLSVYQPQIIYSVVDKNDLNLAEAIATSKQLGFSSEQIDKALALTAVGSGYLVPTAMLVQPSTGGTPVLYLPKWLKTLLQKLWNWMKD